MQWPHLPANPPEPVCDGQALRYYRRRCSSFDPRLLALVLGSLALVSMVVSIAFALAGAWMIIPFAGLEIAALVASACWVLRRSGDFERVAFDEGRLTIERAERGRLHRHEFHAGWARLVTNADGSLALRSHGREIAIARYCGESGRMTLERALRERLARHGF